MVMGGMGSAKRPGTSCAGLQILLNCALLFSEGWDLE
jgi:hypothetical protein